MLLLEGHNEPPWLAGEDRRSIEMGLQSSESTSWMVRRLGHADTKISVIKAIEVQLQTQLASRGGVVEIHADVLFCDGYVKDSFISLKASQRNGGENIRSGV